MTKLIVFSNMYPSEYHPTYGIFVKNQVQLLKDAGHDVTVVAIDNPAKGAFAKLKKYAGLFVRGFFQMLKGRKSVQLTHSHYAFPTGMLSYYGKKLFNIPYVITVHGGDIDQMANKGPRIRRWTQRILKGADAVITVGEKLKQDVLQQFGVSNDKVHVLSMGVDPTVFHVMPQELARETLGISKDETMILYVGNIIRAKGLDELIEAYKQITYTKEQLSLYMIGSQKDEQYVESVKDRLNVLDNVHLINPQNQSSLAKWMSASDVFVLPSHHEGFGLVALEAMAVGVPVVGTNVGGLPYLLKDGAGILVEPHNPASLAEGIVEALDRSEERYTEAKQRIVEEHSYDTLVERLEWIYTMVGRTKKE
ncbi:glycosyltransferase [Planococcaceae bacterium Storch 2/2-2]|nr:glycosyltransferase [Planococcaceae bacterium Storch 2/2-2]